MSKIFELFGHRMDSWTADAQENLAKANCPFMGSTCDGGGNRQMSAIKLCNHPQLQEFFPGFTTVQAGVCSLSISENSQPWIVCPRRLLSLRANSDSAHQEFVRQKLSKHSELPTGEYRAWSEVKMKVATSNDFDEEKFFDYTFDYVIAGSASKSIDEVSGLTGFSTKECRKKAEENGFTMACRGGTMWIENFPADPIVIVEIMTSSTSGGNKENRTQIAMAFEDAILKNQDHKGPGINYRQVWARMVSQLIVKSQVAMAWNSKTIWMIQDVLAEYISNSTALNLRSYLSDHAGEVNILAFGYGSLLPTSSIFPLKEASFYSGPITKAKGDGGFVDIVKIGAAPPKSQLWKTLFNKAPSGKLRVEEAF